MKAALLLIGPLAVMPLMAQTPPDLALYQQVLTKYVEGDGNVKYGALRAGLEPLDLFVQQIGAVSPDSHPASFPTSEAKLAYWLNAYNALVLWAIAKDYPKGKTRLNTVLGQAKFFYRDKFLTGGRQRTLSDIEDNSLRAGFRDPRIHFAIVCASKGCPWLSRTAYTALNVDAELDQRTRLFFTQKRNLQVSSDKKEVRLSSIFKWFEKDFGKTRDERIRYVARYAPPEAAVLLNGQWRIQYVDWDWSLNDSTTT